MGTVVGVGVVVVVVLLVLNRRAVGRLFSAASAEVGEVGRAASAKTANARYQEQVDDMSSHLQEIADGLGKSDGLVKNLDRQVNYCISEKAKLEARIKIKMNQTPPDEAGAAPYATQLAKVEQDLQTNSDQLARAKTAAGTATKQAQMWQRKIAQVKEDARRDGQELQSSKVEAQLADIFNSLGKSPVSSDLSETRAEVQRQIDDNHGKLQAAMAMNASAVQEMEDDEEAEKASASSILDRFRKPAAAA